MTWGTESYSELAETRFVYLALRTSALGTVKLGKGNTLCCKSRMEMYFYLVLSFFYLLFIIFCGLNFFRIAKWWWLPWVSADGLVRESPRVPNAEAPASFGERWGRVGKIMAKEWSVSLRLCGVWVGEKDVKSHEGWDCFKIWERNKQTQMKWFLFLKKKRLSEELKFKNITIILS